MKKPFVTAEQLEDIAARYPTPFHLYDAQGIRENARRLKAAFSWNPGYREYFAVKATPTPAILKILQKEGCGCDCSSLTELMMAERIGSVGENIMFSSNETPAEDYRLAAKLGAIINLDDITHVDFLEKTIGYIPKRIGCRFNPGGTFSLGESREVFQVMDNPGDAKYGMTREQITQAFRMLKARGAEEFGIHAFLASNTLSNEYYPALARILFQLAVELQRETGCHITYINLSGGVGIPYRPEESENDIAVIGEGVRKVYEEILVPAGMGDVALCTGCAAGGAAESTPAPDMSDLPLDGGYAYLRVEVLSRDKDAKTLEVKVLDFGDADGVNVGALPVGAQGTVDCSDLLSMAMMIDSGEWIITYADLGQQAFPLRLTSIENPEHFAERAGK